MPKNSSTDRLSLELPSAAWSDSYRGHVAEFVARGEKLVPFTLSFPHDDFGAMVERLHAASRGEGVEGFVANTTWWLVRDGLEVVGVGNMRHELTDSLRREGGHVGYGIRPSARGQGCATELLRLMLIEARGRGLEEVLLTCAKDNVASARTILRNGGRFVSEEPIPERGEIVQRYLIRLLESES